MYDKMVADPRLSMWYGKRDGQIMTAELLEIKQRVEEFCAKEFDSVLLNLYWDGKDSVSWHSDKKPAVKIHPLLP